MGVFSSSRQPCYCAFCKTERMVYRKKHISLLNIFAATMGAGALMYTIWQKFDPRALFIFVVFLAIAEVFIQMRWRITLVCKHCGFDPALYVRAPEQAAKKVQLFLEHKKNDPNALLSKPVKLQPRRRKGSIVSKQI